MADVPPPPPPGRLTLRRGVTRADYNPKTTQCSEKNIKCDNETLRRYGRGTTQEEKDAFCRERKCQTCQHGIGGENDKCVGEPDENDGWSSRLSKALKR